MTGDIDVPRLFRLTVEVDDLGRAAAFYSALFALDAREQGGGRCYFDCGPVTLQVLDVSSRGAVQSLPKSLYFTVDRLDGVFERARELGCLSTAPVHGTPGGQIAERPWGERSFYVDDPWGNSLCFVEAGTVYGG
ncbi:VOC family protein [Kitasatospora sp. NPDC049285]|uniref:VOC family protein n=1 Tax=Kitasatospora sp. NPDC049285 TaxID=3157096 RepID=UPI0034467A17